jgi:hypothetical protein
MSNKVIQPTAEELAEMNRIDDIAFAEGWDVGALVRLADITADIERLIPYRDELIAAARRQGASLRAIAKAAGMSHVAIAKRLSH